VADGLGDFVNYHFGKFMAPRLFNNSERRRLNTKHLRHTREFYDRYGGKTLILARFVPIARTYAPFVARLDNMAYSKIICLILLAALFG